MSVLKNFQRKDGFSLVELLVVIAIIAILAVLVVMATRMAMRQSRNSKLVSDAKTMKNALIAYSQANEGNYPAAQLPGGGAISAYDLVLDPAPPRTTEYINRTIPELIAGGTNENGIMRPFIPNPDNFRDTDTTDGGFLCYLRNSTWCPTGFCLWVVPDGVNIGANPATRCTGTLVTIRDGANTQGYWFALEGSTN